LLYGGRRRLLGLDLVVVDHVVVPHRLLGLDDDDHHHGLVRHRLLHHLVDHRLVRHGLRGLDQRRQRRGHGRGLD
jgi:hypothetical protein